MAGYSSSAIIWQENQRFDEIEYLIVNVKYFQLDLPVQTKFPIGAVEEIDGSDRIQTLRRECHEETGLIIVREMPELIWHDYTYDPHHPRFWYLVHISECVGELRTARLREKKSILGRPRWVRTSRLEERIFETHREAFQAAQRKLVNAVPRR